MKLFILFILFNSLFSLPRFSLEESASCMSCHINPTGGAMRNDYGSNVYTLDELTIRKWIPKGDEDWDGYLTDNLQLGGEFRIQSYDGNSGSTTFPMQAELYANIDINKDMNIYFELPMGQNGLADNYDIFLLFDELPANMWLKIGKSSPNYGLMVDDHTSFIKAGNGPSANLQVIDSGFRLLFDPSQSKPIMIESGFNFGSGFYMTASVSQSLFDSYSRGKFENYTSSFTYLKDFKDWSMMYGASIMEEKGRGNLGLPDQRVGKDINLLGVFGGFSVSDFIVTFEFDRAYNLFYYKNYDTAFFIESSLAAYLQFVYKPIQGLHLIAKYDFFDHNEQVQNGALSRYTYGFEFYPLNMLEIKFQVRDYKTNYSENDVELKFDSEYLLQLHAWF